MKFFSIFIQNLVKRQTKKTKKYVHVLAKDLACEGILWRSMIIILTTVSNNTAVSATAEFVAMTTLWTNKVRQGCHTMKVIKIDSWHKWCLHLTSPCNKLHSLIVNFSLIAILLKSLNEVFSLALLENEYGYLLKYLLRIFT